MAFDTSEKNLLGEVRASEDLQNPFLDMAEKLLCRYHSPAYGDRGDEGSFLENTYFEYVSLILSRILYDNPRVRVETRRPGSQRQVAEAIRHGLNRWVRDTDFRTALVPIAVDMFFGWGIALVTRTPIPGMRPSESWVMDEDGFKRFKRVPHWPSVNRISPRRFVFDPAALSWEGMRWRGHKVVRVKEDLLAEARADPSLGWDVEAIKSIPAISSGTRDIREKRGQGPVAVERGEIELYEIHVFEVNEDEDHGPEDGFNGTIYTVAEGATDSGAKEARRLRKPRAYYGPQGGGYVLFGVYEVPDSPIPLSPLIPVNALIEELNRQVRAESENAAAYKQLLLSADPQLTELINSGKHLHSYTANVPDLSKNIASPAVGGMDPRAEGYIEIVRQRMNRNLGMDDVHRGSSNPGGTATQAAIADEAATARMDQIKHRFRSSGEAVLNIAGHFLYHDNEVVYPLGPEAAKELGMGEPWFFGGDFDEASGATYEDLELEIEAYSMERTSEALQQRRALELTALVTNLLPLAPRLSLYTDLKTYLDRVGEQANIPHLSEILYIDEARKLGAAEFQLAAAGAMSEGGGAGGGGQSKPGGQPRLSVDVGRAGQSRPAATGTGLPGNFSGAAAGAKSKVA